MFCRACVGSQPERHGPVGEQGGFSWAWDSRSTACCPDCPVSGPDRGTVRGPGWGRPSKPCWPLGPSENRFLAYSPQHCPAPSQPEAVVIAKPSAMETIVQPGEQAACREGSLSARCACRGFIMLPSHPPCCSVVLGLCPSGPRSAPFEG